MNEKRKFKRFGCAVDVEYASQGKKAAEIPSRTRNFSREGACIIAPKKLRKDSALSLKFTIPDDFVPFFARAKVMWTGKNAAGLKFLKMENSNKYRLLDYAYNQWVKLTRKETK